MSSPRSQCKQRRLPSIDTIAHRTSVKNSGAGARRLQAYTCLTIRPPWSNGGPSHILPDLLLVHGYLFLKYLTKRVESAGLQWCKQVFMKYRAVADRSRYGFLPQF